MNNLGMNTVNFPVEKLKEFKIDRAEICLGRGNTYEERLKKALEDIDKCDQMGITYSIHLPIFIEEWYPYDYLSAYFLDPDPRLRELALRLLEMNIEKMCNLNTDFYVLHFAGVYNELQNKEVFRDVLETMLNKVNDIAKGFNTKILIEYFGSNSNFYDYNQWVDLITKQSHLGILTDLGHLHFASKMNHFDFDEALEVLMHNSDGFHIWTTMGDETYFDSECYKQYHHIITRLNQKKTDRWAYNTKEILVKLKSLDKPMIIEASKHYEGETYFLDGVKECVELLSK